VKWLAAAVGEPIVLVRSTDVSDGVSLRLDYRKCTAMHVTHASFTHTYGNSGLLIMITTGLI
jgi:hypothetical protein